jgi:hypothetical protein
MPRRAQPANNQSCTNQLSPLYSALATPASLKRPVTFPCLYSNKRSRPNCSLSPGWLLSLNLTRPVEEIGQANAREHSLRCLGSLRKSRAQKHGDLGTSVLLLQMRKHARPCGAGVPGPLQYPALREVGFVGRIALLSRCPGQHVCCADGTPARPRQGGASHEWPGQTRCRCALQIGPLAACLAFMSVRLVRQSCACHNQVGDEPHGNAVIWCRLHTDTSPLLELARDVRPQRF